MKRIVSVLFTLLSAHLCFSQQTDLNEFSFIAFGDMPYNLPQDYPRFENLIETVNKENQVFNVFVGDIKSSSLPCSETHYKKIFTYFNEFKKPLIYTPGDNEWTDCGIKTAKKYDPEERLQVIRKLFFKIPIESLGKNKMTLKTESTFPEFAKFVENQAWEYNGVSFATMHNVGSNNNFLPTSKDRNKEFFERSEANIFWLNKLFDQANERNSMGIVIFQQADMFTSDQGMSGFITFLDTLKQLTQDFGKPVLLINGDSHIFKVDKPLYADKAKEKLLLNFTRVQVFGEEYMHAVKITVNPEDAALFEIQQFWVPKNK